MNQAIWIVSEDEDVNFILKTECTMFNEQYGAAFNLRFFPSIGACSKYGSATRQVPFYLITEDVKEALPCFSGCIFIQHGGELPPLPDRVVGYLYSRDMLNMKNLYCDILHAFV